MKSRVAQRSFLFILTLAVAGFVSPGYAAGFGSDSADDPAYSGGWTNGSNGGSGFGPWTVGGIDDNNDGTNNAGVFIGSSANNGDGDTNSDGDIDSSGDAWGTFANTDDLAQGVRSLSGTLSVGQTFSIDMDNGFVDGAVGVGLQNNTGRTLWEFFFQGGQANYRVSDAAGVNDTGIGFTDEGVSLDFTLTTATGYSLGIEDGNGNTDTVTGTLLNPAGGQDIAQVRVFNFNGGGGASNDAFFNNMAVVPEPGTMALFGIATAGLVALRRRRS